MMKSAKVKKGEVKIPVTKDVSFGIAFYVSGI
jgi:hypothetical protein